MALKQMLWVLLRWALLALALAVVPGTASAQVTCDPNAPLIQASNFDEGNRQDYAFSSFGANKWSSDGRYLVIDSKDFIYYYDRLTCQYTFIDLGDENADYSVRSSITNDGRYVVFFTSAPVLSTDTNNKQDVFRHDMQSGTTIRVSLSPTGQQLDWDSYNAIIAGEGRYITYLSNDQLLLHDLQTDLRQIITTAIFTDPLDITPDGRFVVFRSYGSTIVPNDNNNSDDIFIFDRQTSQTTRVSVSSNGAEGEDSSYFAQVSDDGRYVIFDSYSNNLVENDTNNREDVFLRDRQTGLTSRISISNSGIEGDGYSSLGAISADGYVVAFQSDSINFAPGKTTTHSEIYVRDLISGNMILATTPSNGGWADRYSFSPVLSPDGQYLAFTSTASNLLPGDEDNFCSYDPGIPPAISCTDVFVRRLYGFKVTSRSDTTDGACNAAHCSLREAILAANASQQPAIIDFSIAGAGVKIIQPTSALPTITVPLTINGASQPGYSGTPLIQLDGSLAGANTNGLTINSAGSNVNGMTITRFSGHGIVLSGDGFNSIRNNLIGTDANSAVDLGNGGNGILVSSGSGNAITDNSIHNNAANGVAILTGTGHVIRTNSISNNGSLGIDLGNNGVTANDMRDTDSGPNQQQNYPLINSVAFSNNQLTISGVIKSSPSATLSIALFQNTSCDASGHGEGSNLLGAVTVTANALGEAVFTFQAVGQSVGVITATATDGNSNTSEFSACRAVGTSIDDPPDTPLRNLFTSSTPTLTWATVRFAALYEIQVDDNEDFSSPEYANAAIPSTQLQVMTSALADGLYYWRVRAINGSGLPGLWSAVDTFVVDVP